MKYIVENWFVIVGLIAVLAAGGYAVYVFVKMPSDKQLNKVREWLLYAVTKAEKEMGGGTGQIKLRYVYDMFVTRFAWLARVISFEAFSMMVDEALEKMKKMLANDIVLWYYYKEMREEMRECGDCYIDTDEARFGKAVTRVCGFILSIPAALMWWGTPLIVGCLMLYDKIQEKNPELCGFTADEFDKEENK